MSSNPQVGSTTRSAILEAFRKECAENVDETNSSLGSSLDQLFATVPMGIELVNTAKQFLAVNSPSFDFYSKQVKQFDSRTACGLVWASNYIAYRCRTCGISPCMSLCADCFEAGPHRAEKHDFSMFRSQAGGACDCGDSSVLKVEGFCAQHGTVNASRRPPAPDALRISAARVLPRLVSRFIIHLRMVRRGAQLNAHFDEVCALFVSLSSLGSVMIDLITQVLCDSDWYLATLAPGATYNRRPCSVRSEQELLRSCELYREAIDAACTVPRVQTLESDRYREYLTVEHKCALDELTFWLIRHTLHQPLINFLLSYLPNDTYKQTFSFSFVRHYALLAKALAKALHSRNLNYDLQNTSETSVDGTPNGSQSQSQAQSDSIADTDSLEQFSTTYEDDEQPAENVSARTLAHRIVHVSVQLLSNEQLVSYLLVDAALLERILAALRILFELEQAIEKCKLSYGYTQQELPNQTVDTSKRLLRKHAYWCIVSDLINVLTHRSAVEFLVEHRPLLSEMLRIVSLFQAMNVNRRELHMHVEFEPDTYFVSFLAEFELCATPMYSVYTALADGAFPTSDSLSLTELATVSDRVDKVRSMVVAIDAALSEWLTRLGSQCDQLPARDAPTFSPTEMTFHLPLQRFLATFLSLRYGIAKSLRNLLARSTELDSEVRNRLELLLDRANEPLLSQSKVFRFTEPVLFTLSGHLQIQNGLWVRNGTQIRNQAITYQQAHFNEAMIDLDLSLAQIAAAQVDPNRFVGALIDRLLVRSFLRIADRPLLSSRLADAAQADGLLESLCVLLCWLVTESRAWLTSPADNVRTSAAIRRELVAALSVTDRTHSHALEHALDRCGTARDARELAEGTLRKVANYRAPTERDANGTLTQGTYSLGNAVWTDEFDAIHTLLRCAYRADYQKCLERYLDRAGSEKQRADARRRGVTLTNFWPPLRIPSRDNYLSEPEPMRASRLLQSSAFYGLAFVVLHRSLGQQTAASGQSNATSQRDTLIYVVHLLRLAVAFRTYEKTEPEEEADADFEPTTSESVVDLDFESWFPESISGDVFKCLLHKIGNVFTSPLGSAFSVNESIITMLGKIYRRLVDTDYVTPRHGAPSRNSLFPTGADVIGSLLDSVYSARPFVARRMDVLFISGRPAAADGAEAASGAIDKKQAARDRQRKLLESMANKQQAFLARLVTTDETPNASPGIIPQAMETDQPETPVDEQTSYTCVICNSSDDEASVVGLIALAHPTALSLHRFVSDDFIEPNGNGDTLPLSNEAVNRRNASTWRSSIASISACLSEKCGDTFALLSGVAAAPVAVHVRSCGHYVHASCLKGYRDSLEQSGIDYVRQAYRVDVRANEFQCPLCRQLANSIIPVLRPFRHAMHPTPPTPQPPVAAATATQPYAAGKSRTNSHSGSSFFSLFRRSSGSHSSSAAAKPTVNAVVRQASVSGSGYASPEWPPTLGHCDVLQRVGALRDANARPFDMETVLVGAMASVFEACAGAQQQNTSAVTYHSACSATLNDWTRLVNLNASPYYKGVYFGESSRVPVPFAAATICHAVEYELSLIVADYETHVTVSGARRLATLRHLIAAAQSSTRPFARAYARIFDRLAGAGRSVELEYADPFVSVLLCEPLSLLSQLVLAVFTACAIEPAVVDALVRACARLVVVRALLSAILVDARSFVHAYVNADWRALAETSIDGSLPPGVASSRWKIGKTTRGLLEQLMAFIKPKLFDMTELERCAGRDEPIQPMTIQDMIENVRTFAIDSLSFYLRRFALLRHAVSGCSTVSPNAALNNLFSEFDQARTVEQMVGVVFDCVDDEDDVLEVVLGANSSMFVSQWLSELNEFSLIELRTVLRFETPQTYTLLSRAPSFVGLPHTYDVLFQSYTKAICSVCSTVPSDPLVCLACGSLVCMSGKCCVEKRDEEDVHEAVQHAARCGAGLMVCLSVNSTSIIVLSGSRICIWGSLYLDEHGEEDRDLKRGRPLFLKDERYELLTKQWRMHAFDEVCKNWVWHDNRY